LVDERTEVNINENMESETSDLTPNDVPVNVEVPEIGTLEITAKEDNKGSIDVSAIILEPTPEVKKEVKAKGGKKESKSTEASGNDLAGAIL
jgi:hypothetical protein